MGNQRTRKQAICKLRVLIVENRLTTRQVHVDNVTRWGYEPVVAEGVGEALLQHALELARTQCCHLALVDKRLRDDYKNSDISGIDLIEKIQPTSTILITGYPDHESTLAAMQKGTVTVVAKKGGPDAVRKALQEAAALWHPTTDIRWPSGWSTKRVANLLVEDEACASTFCEDEADYIIAKLFSGAKKVVLKRLNGSTKSDSSARIPSFRLGSLVFIVYEDDKVPVIVKLLSKKKATKEKENYDQFIRGYVGNNRYASMEGSQTLWHLGGHKYRLIRVTGQEILTFDELYARNIQDQKLLDILEDFFKTTWVRNRDQVKRSSRSLFELYDHNWEGKLSQRLDDWRKEPEVLRKSKTFPISLPHPLRWIADHLDDSNLPGICVAVVHGDLHGGNILLDEQYFTWVIDYEDTGYGHVLRDYAELAQNIMTRLHPGPYSQLQWLYALAVSLAAPANPHQRIPSNPTIDNNPHSLRAYSILRAIQKFADELTGYQQSQEFLWAILLDIAKVYAALSKDRKRQKRLLYLGGLLCHRVDHWGDTEWPPKEWATTVWK
ncbi:MAG: phosphotransferase [Caldilineaceae bacterium]|nr:phosphotransferase [Caldilineaceae bacterium]MBP8122325.1 phosphotransferase [Caldilineaceae bacterium]MBP9072683.1 phosphotransferase [Caldilineaceae bacterium]